LGELDQSVADIVQASQEIARLLHSLGKRQNRERAMRLIFEAFDADHSDEWSLPEFNTFQQALGKEALLEATLTELFGGCSTISFEKFVSTYENYPAARLFEMMRQLGIGKKQVRIGQPKLVGVAHSLTSFHVQARLVTW
jgi:hypothetical protein